MGIIKQAANYWEINPCIYGVQKNEYSKADFDEMEVNVYERHPYLFNFAQYSRYHGKKVLDVGIGAGTEFIQWVRSGCAAIGCDYSQKAVELTKSRLEAYGLKAGVCRADCENLPFGDESYDVVYSFGMIHHLSDPQKGVEEIYRVLKKGGCAKVMLYHVNSWVALNLWIRNGLLRGRPFISIDELMSRYMESSGTKIFSKKSASRLFSKFSDISIYVQITPYDYDCIPLIFRCGLARAILRMWSDRIGWNLMITAKKNSGSETSTKCARRGWRRVVRGFLSLLQDIYCVVRKRGYVLWHYIILHKRKPSFYAQFVRSTNPFPRPKSHYGISLRIKKHNRARDYSRYDEKNFFDVIRYENFDYYHERVRKEDMGCAALYAFGIRSFQKAQELFPETIFDDQVACIKNLCSDVPERPLYVADIGCGLGALTALMLACGARVDAVDPSPFVKTQIEDIITRFTREPMPTYEAYYRYYAMNLESYMSTLIKGNSFPDVFFLVEAIEHIPRKEVFSAIDIMRKKGNCKLIITNVVDLFPIWPDGTGWNHISFVDEAYYDRLSRCAKKEIMRSGSHLVLQF